MSCDQAIHGILLVNKPEGLSSNAVLQRVKKLYRAKKAGHTGSLDPLATGMLPICLGEATKFSQYLLNADKVYEATAILGIKTNTGDALGQIIEEQDDVVVSLAEIQKAIRQFTGAIRQVPSMFSALKHKGVPLYKYAREGISIEREARNVMIYQLELTGFNGKRFTIKVSCSKGTYIRNLVEDIGDYLGVGAHVSQLHRVCTSGFDDETMYSLADLQEKSSAELFACLLPMERAVIHFPAVSLNNDELLALRQGKVLKSKNREDFTGFLRLHNEAGQFIGLGELSLGELSVKRLLTEEATKAIF
ncbi:tRNA pseudouridine synthase B [Legionella clemsonensis]|uniref:tRNA pseudouridine synthase B n=2 Tax=Legionella clemsonensis TaxID=1867846 RepID=A0A222NZ68_9GAMM|nr:tRNA pseudouridine synthase B [Legionella clemsonensis]